MKKFALVICLILQSTISYSREEEILNLLAEKMVTDFHKGVELYNAEKEAGLPEIKMGDDTYLFKYKKNSFRFSIVNYLNDQIYINDQLKKIPLNLSAPKTSWLNVFINIAHAEEELDADSTKILLQTLSTFTIKLDKIGFTCITSSCKAEVRNKNMKRILAELEKKKDDCAERQQGTGESLNRFGRTNSLYSLQMTVGSEFNGVKEVMKKVVSANKKEVNNFLEDHLNIESKPHKTCIQVMVAGTAAEMKGGLNNLKKYAEGGPNQAIIEDAKKTCVAMEELKSCLVTLQADSQAINSHKRQAKQNDVDNFPDVKTKFSNGLTK